MKNDKYMRWITRTILVILTVTFFVSWLLPTNQMPGWGVWVGILLVTGCSFYLSLVYRHFVGTWRGFVVLTMALYAALTWLRWQWWLWESPLFLVQNLNVIVCLLAWVLCIGLGISSLLLLIYHDAGVIFLSISWLICPLFMLIARVQYGQLDQFLAAPLGQQLPWGVLMMWMEVIWCCAPPLLLFQLGMALYKELKARKTPQS